MVGARTRSSSRSRTTARAAPSRLLRLLRLPRLPEPRPWAAPRRSLGAIGALGAILIGPAAVAADLPAPLAASAVAAPAPRVVEVRIALSSSALKKLSEPRLRRLLEIELEGSAVLAPGAVGPLGDHVAYIWVDRPTERQISIEVRVGDRPVARRDIAAAAGLTGDVAARLVAIAASELVRDQMEPLRAAPRRPLPPRRPADGELEIASRGQPALQIVAGGEVAFLPAAATVLAGPSLGVGFRYEGVSETLFARWLTGPSPTGALRWLELGVAADYRLWLSPSWRLVFGGEAALASAHLGDAHLVAGFPAERDTWSARAGGRLGAELHLEGPVWLSLTATPGAIVRPVRYEGAAGKGALEGLWLGVGAGLSLEWGRKATLPGSSGL